MRNFLLTFLVLFIILLIWKGANYIVAYTIVSIFFFVIFCLLYATEKTMLKKIKWAKWIKWTAYVFWIGIIFIDVYRYAYFCYLCPRETKIEIYDKEKYNLFKKVRNTNGICVSIKVHLEECEYEIRGDSHNKTGLWDIPNLFDLIKNDDSMNSVFILYDKKSNKPLMLYYNNEGNFHRRKGEKYHEVLVNVETADIIYQVNDVIAPKGIISILQNPYWKFFSCIGYKKGAFAGKDYISLRSMYGMHGIRELAKTDCKYKDNMKPICSVVDIDQEPNF